MDDFLTIMAIIFSIGILILNVILVVVFFDMAKNIKSILAFIKSYRAMKIDNSKWMCPTCGSMNYHDDKYCQSCNKSIFGY